MQIEPVIFGKGLIEKRASIMFERFKQHGFYLIEHFICAAAVRQIC